MYERNAIVLERYFNDLFKYRETSNIKENFKNYCELIDNLEKYNIATENESSANFDFDNAKANIKKIQKNGEKLYNKSAKLEYSRYIVYENIEEKSEEIVRCLDKIENDVEKNNESLKILDEEFKASSDNYKEKREKLAKCQKENKEAKQAYEKSLKRTKEIIAGISKDDVDVARDFLVSENKDRKKELNGILNDNGKSERNPFDVDVISNAVEKSFEIYLKEIDLLLNAYERTVKLLSEIEESDVKMDKHKKLIKDTTVKLHFLSAQKDYIFGFLDNERIAAIYDKKIHRKLMLEACRNLESDMVHINSMYEIILKEAASRGSKRLYKDNYNINYLDDIEKVAENAQEETNKLKGNAVAVMNLNYWRIEGIHKIQNVFEEDMLKVYERDIKEIFPEKFETEEPTEEPKKKEIEENKESKKIKYKKLKSSKSILKGITTKENKKNEEEITKKETSNEEKPAKKEKAKKEKVLPEEIIEEETTAEEVSEDIAEESAIEEVVADEKIEQENIEDETNEDNEQYDEDNYVDDSDSGDESSTESDEDVNEDSDEDDEAYSEESASLFDKISMLDELEEDFDESEIGKSDIKQMMVNKISEDSKNSKMEKNSKDTYSFEDDDYEDSIIDFYFSNSDNAEKKRKEKDEKKLEKDSKKGIFQKLMGSNSRNKKEAKI